MLGMEENIFTDMYKSDLNDVEYVKHLNKVIEYGRKIMDMLGPDSLLFLEYERSACLAKGIRLEGAYRLGMENGKLAKYSTCPTECPTESLVI